MEGKSSKSLLTGSWPLKKVVWLNSSGTEVVRDSQICSNFKVEAHNTCQRKMSKRELAIIVRISSVNKWMDSGTIYWFGEEDAIASEKGWKPELMSHKPKGGNSLIRKKFSITCKIESLDSIGEVSRFNLACNQWLHCVGRIKSLWQGFRRCKIRN